MEWMEWFFVAAVCGFVGALIGKAFDKLGLGLLLGALFGPFGWLIVLIVGLLSGRERRGAAAYGAGRPSAAPRPMHVPCPICLEPVIKGAKMCPHCRSAIEWPKEPKRVVKLGGVEIKPRRLVVRPKR